MPETSDWIHAVRSSHERFKALVAPLSVPEVEQPSYASEWSIAAVASHLGSQAEIFGLSLDAGLSGAPAPGGELFGQIWDRWNALAPAEQVTQSVAANEEFVSRLEQITAEQREAFSLSMFGTDLDLAGLAGMRLGEHALHTWDVAVTLDPTEVVSADAVELLVDTLPRTAARGGKPVEGAGPVDIVTSGPERRFHLELSPAVELKAVDSSEVHSEGEVHLPAEALVRLVAGRLDPAHTPAGVEAAGRLDELRAAFPGF